MEIRCHSLRKSEAHCESGTGAAGLNRIAEEAGCIACHIGADKKRAAAVMGQSGRYLSKIGGSGELRAMADYSWVGFEAVAEKSAQHR